MRGNITRTYPYDDHLRALGGTFLDAGHRRLILQLPLRELHGQENVAAAILKARHDLLYWRPQLAGGAGGSAIFYLEDLRENIRLLESHRASMDTPGMYAIWSQTRKILQDWLPQRSSLVYN